MNNRIVGMCLIFAALFPFSAFANQLTPITNNYTQNDIYSGDPGFDKLKPTIAATDLFRDAPARMVKQLDLYSIQLDNDQYYSHYRITPIETKDGRSLYETREDVTQGSRFPGITVGQHAIVNGKGISFGGIFWPQEVMRVTNDQGKLVYYNKIDITSITPISGHLFPLKVGNDLCFYFTRLHEKTIGNVSTFENETGIMEYKVIAHITNYSNSNKKVPGDIYTLQIWESTNIHPKRYLTDIYDYATGLGWYVTDTYYSQNNKVLAMYIMKDWQ